MAKSTGREDAGREGLPLCRIDLPECRPIRTATFGDLLRRVMCYLWSTSRGPLRAVRCLHHVPPRWDLPSCPQSSSAGWNCGTPRWEDVGGAAGQGSSPLGPRRRVGGPSASVGARRAMGNTRDCGVGGVHCLCGLWVAAAGQSESGSSRR